MREITVTTDTSSFCQLQYHTLCQAKWEISTSLRLRRMLTLDQQFQMIQKLCDITSKATVQGPRRHSHVQTDNLLADIFDLATSAIELQVVWHQVSRVRCQIFR